MPDAAHNYARGDRAALILFSAGTCYFPGCTEPLLKQVKGSYEIALTIAHIRAARKGGERYVENMEDTARAAFNNIIFLCVVHHKIIDKPGAAATYTIKLLTKWKKKRERGAPEQLRGLREVTEDKLVKMISTAVKEREADYQRTLERLEKNDKEAADLLRELRTELEGLSGSGSILDPNMVGMLYHAASNLLGLGDYAPVLARAADDLHGLEDNATRLNEAGSRLSNIEEYVGQLSEATERLHEAEAYISELSQATSRLNDAERIVGQLSQLIGELHQVAGRIEEAGNQFR